MSDWSTFGPDVVAGLITGVVTGLVVGAVLLLAQRRGEQNRTTVEIQVAWDSIKPRLLKAAQRRWVMDVSNLNHEPDHAAAVATLVSDKPIALWGHILESEMRAVQHLLIALDDYRAAALSLEPAVIAAHRMLPSNVPTCVFDTYLARGRLYGVSEPESLRNVPSSAAVAQVRAAASLLLDDTRVQMLLPDFTRAVDGVERAAKDLARDLETPEDPQPKIPLWQRFAIGRWFEHVTRP